MTRLVIALVHWRVTGFRRPVDEEGERGVREGLFTHVFVERDGIWEITASHNAIQRTIAGHRHRAKGPMGCYKKV